MLKRFFIPVLLVLLTVAGAMYWLLGDARGPRDLREAVPVEKFTLRNGLRVLVMPNQAAPAVTHLLLVRAGGADDPYGKTGLAHYLEHLMFMGTKDYPQGTYERNISRVGGEQNAYTTYDYTAYYATVPKDSLASVMAMEADRLSHVQFSDEVAARELKVITEERNMRVENKAAALFAEQMDALTFLNHPYGRPLIGWAEDMQSLTAADAKAFFQRHYRTGNMVLLVAGDVEPREVRKLAQQYYGALPAMRATARDWPKEPPVRMQRRGTMEDEKAQEPRLLRHYIAPSVQEGKTELAMPLSLLAQYLGGGTTSAFYQRLVLEQKLATHVSASYDVMRAGPSIFRIAATPAPGVTLAQLERALDAVIEEALGTLPAEEAVQRVKTQLKAEVIFAQDGLSSLAHVMGQIFMIGRDEGYFYGWTDAVDAVTATDMLNAAQAVLDPARKVTGRLLPAHAPAVGVVAEEPAMPEAVEPPPANEAGGSPEEGAQP